MEAPKPTDKRSITTEDTDSPGRPEPAAKKMKLSDVNETTSEPIRRSAARTVALQVSSVIEEISGDSRLVPDTRRKVIGILISLLEESLDYGDDDDAVKREVLNTAESLQQKDSTLPFIGRIMDVYRKTCETCEE